MNSLFEKYGWVLQSDCHGDFWAKADTNISYRVDGNILSLYRDGKPTGTKWDLENPQRFRAWEKHIAASSKPPKTWEDEIRAGFERVLKVFKSVVERERSVRKSVRRRGDVALEELYPGDYFAYGNEVYQYQGKNLATGLAAGSVAYKGPNGEYIPRVPGVTTPWRVFKVGVKVRRVEFRVVE